MIRIEHFTERHIPDPDGDVSPGVFHSVRNAVVKVCKQHGPTGPMGFLPSEEELPEGANVLQEWLKTADPNPVYFVLDDQYNSERYQYIECGPEDVTEGLILDLMAMVKDIPGWGVGISGIPMGFVLVFADKVMISGDRFRGINELPALVANAHCATINEEQTAARPKSGSCQNYHFENDSLVGNVDYGDSTFGTLTIDRNSVKSVWRHPFIEGWMLSLKKGNIFDLPDEEAFNKISEWFGQVVN